MTPKITLKLDANELPFEESLESRREEFPSLLTASLNRYPDANASALCTHYASFQGVADSNIIAGNGSDEVLDLIYKAFTTQGDTIVSLEPSFVMYGMMAKLFKCRYVGVPISHDQNIQVDVFIEAITTHKPRLVFICNPNNPTGALIQKEDLYKILEATSGLVIVDEAYSEFICDGYQEYSLIDSIGKFKNLIVLKTLSKAYGLAGLRIGFGLANEELIKALYSVKYPYNISLLSQNIALTLINEDFMSRLNDNRLCIINEREKLYNKLESLKYVTPYPSSANFIWLEVNTQVIDLSTFSEALKNSGIAIRQFDKGELKSFLRVTLGTPQENELFFDTFKTLLEEGTA